ncbi:DUF3156 family protein [Pseudomonas abieticivorans]|uniref:DUF3156 family protein n=1 Tax=Pseudomonas abieticivorans TaxID=2931382 RepID=UPI0020BF29A6|nr:DUF3156 family protein [Pseudomonas sp. PIA16]
MSLSLPTLKCPARLQRLFDRAPSGYRAGVTLEQLRRNLGIGDFQVTAPGQAQVRLGDWLFEVHEQVQSQLLMHVVTTEFVLRVPASRQGVARFEVHHSGSLRRTGLACRHRGGEVERVGFLQQRLSEEGHLKRALMPLDFKRLSIEQGQGQWTVRLEHLGGSEVVNRLPAFRRYIRLSLGQRDHLLQGLICLGQTLHGV